jgi:hypothetical protein
MLNQFSNLSCYEEFEIQCTLMGISKIDILKEIGHKISRYYVFVSNDGVFNWFDLNGNHIENPGVLKEIKEEYIPKNIIKCVILNSVTSIGDFTFWNCKSLKEIIIPDSVTSIGAYVFHNYNLLKEVIFKGKTLDEVKQMENYPWDINDESIIKCEM